MTLPFDLTRFCFTISLIFGLGALTGFLMTRLTRLSPQPDQAKAGRLALSLALWLTTVGGALMAGLGLWYFRWDATHGGAGRAMIGAVPVQIGLPLGQHDPTRGLYLDPLAALFLLCAGLLIVCVAIYSRRWLADHPKRHLIAGGFNLFALALGWVLLANDIFWLLLSLQLTILTSGYLLLEHSWQRKPSARTRTALQTYLIVGQVAILSFGAALLILAVRYEGFNFDAFRGRDILTVAEIAALEHRLLPLFAHTAFLLGLTGIAIWVGLVPFHVWVPLVQAQLPTNIQALLSGLGLKVGIYLAVRLFFEFLTPVSWSWGAIILLVGAITSLVGVFYASFSPNLKLALAYHSVQNSGLILVGLGVAVVFSSAQLQGIGPFSQVAGLALIASLYHTFNHAIFKMLLLLSAGSIEYQTGTLVINRLGGVWRRFPWTGGTFLTGALAMIGLPSLNGFIGVWLMLQSFFAGWGVFQGPISDTRLVVIGPWLMMILSLTLLLQVCAFGMTTLALVRLCGEVLLGFPRDQNLLIGEKRVGLPWSMQGVQVVLAGLCLLLGLGPVLVMPWLKTTARSLGHRTEILQVTAAQLVVQVPGDELPVAILPLLLAGSVLLPFLAGVAVFLWHRRYPPQRGPLWQGGERYESQVLPPINHTLPSLVGRMFLWGVPDTWPDQPLPHRLTKDGLIIEIFNGLYNLGLRRLIQGANRFGNWFQNGDADRYLVYIFLVLALIIFILIAVTN